MPKPLAPTLAVAWLLGLAGLCGPAPAGAQGAGPDREGLGGPGLAGPARSPALDDSEQGTGDGEQSPEEVLLLLGTQGFEGVGELRRDGVDYVTEATWLGERVRVRVSAETGRVVEPRTLSERQARERLRQEGYADVEGLVLEGELYRGTARREGGGGERAPVTVSVLTGLVAEAPARVDGDAGTGASGPGTSGDAASGAGAAAR